MHVNAVVVRLFLYKKQLMQEFALNASVFKKAVGVDKAITTSKFLFNKQQLLIKQTTRTAKPKNKRDAADSKLQNYKPVM